MKKKEILRGSKLFKRVAIGGRRIDSPLLHCRYLVLEWLDSGEDTKIFVGFKVSAKDFNAVRRNRLKRLMREAMRLEYHSLQASLPRPTTGIAMVLYFKGRDDVLVRRLSLAAIRKEVRVICQTLQAQLSESA